MQLDLRLRLSPMAAPTRRTRQSTRNGGGIRTIVLGPTVPPVIGEAVVIDRFSRLISTSSQVQKLAFMRPAGRGQLANVLSRLAAVLKATALVFQRGPVVLYVSFPRGFSAAALILPMLVARMRRAPIYVHHHNVDYIQTKSLVSGLAIRAAGPAAEHIVLCGKMGRSLQQIYRVARSVELSNAAFVDVKCDDSAVGDAFRLFESQVTIGHYSLLGKKKGLDIVLGQFDFLRSQGWDVRLVLAGPTASDAAAADIAEAQSRTGNIVSLGYLDQSELRDYFSNIDIFLFPSLTEGQGLVALEAAAFGVPTIAFDVGCVASNPGAIVVRTVPEIQETLIGLLDGGRKILNAQREKLASDAELDRERWRQAALELAARMASHGRVSF